MRWAFLRWGHIEALGFGVGKLMAAIGLLVGVVELLWVIIQTSAIGAVWILLRGRGRSGQRRSCPVRRLRRDRRRSCVLGAGAARMTARRDAGFSLIEALVALIIAAMALAGVLELQRQLADGQQRYEPAPVVAENSGR